MTASLSTAACSGRSTTTTDEVIIAQFEFDRLGFESAVEAITAEPRITSIEIRSHGATSVEPKGINAERISAVTELMVRHDIDVVSAAPEGPKSVNFMVSAQGLGVSGHAKSLVYDEGRVDGLTVTDTDAEIAKPSDRWRVVYRHISDGWYIRNACC